MHPRNTDSIYLQIMAGKPDFPLSFSGEVWYISLESEPHKKVYIVLDTEQIVFKHYSNRSNHIDDLPADFQIAIKERHIGNIPRASGKVCCF